MVDDHPIIPNQRVIITTDHSITEEVLHRLNEWWKKAPEDAKRRGNAMTRVADGFILCIPVYLPIDVIQSLKDKWSETFPGVPLLVLANTEYLYEQGRSDQGHTLHASDDHGGHPGGDGGRPHGEARVAGEAPGGDGQQPQERSGGQRRAPRRVRGVERDLGGADDASGPGQGGAIVQEDDPQAS